MSSYIRKFMDVDVISFLEEQMKRNTRHYQSDFGIDTHVIKRMAFSQNTDDKTLLWLSRSMGTQCYSEREAFIRGTPAHHGWRYFAEQDPDYIVAFGVELTGFVDGVIRGNAYELDYFGHAAEVADKSVPLFDFQKTFQDGFVAHVPPKRSSYGYYASLVAEHGPIVDARSVPVEEEHLRSVLAHQKAMRARTRKAMVKEPLSAKITDAETRREAAADGSKTAPNHARDGSEFIGR